MASCSVQPVDVSFSSLGRSLLVGTTIGLGIGIGVGTGLLIIKHMTKTNSSDKDIVICMRQITDEMKELRLVLRRQREELLIVPVKETKITEKQYSANALRDLLSLNSDEDEEFYDFSPEEDVAIPATQTEQVMQRYPCSSLL